MKEKSPNQEVIFLQWMEVQLILHHNQSKFDWTEIVILERKFMM
jgi:hypothetical protein